MLITNFAAGELAETLFGRTDIPQYFQGVSRLENFDVIPTGGIERRGGMRRIGELGGEGRIIPFLIDRQRHFLLLLFPGGITAYRVQEGAPLPVTVTASGVSWYSSMEVIRDAQYYQLYDKLILVHRDYPPVILKYGAESFTASRFTASWNVEVKVSDPNITPATETDQYANSAWLNAAGHYPGSAAFMDGRVVFGGTATNRQRLFFSRILGKDADSGVYRFAAYKKYLTEERSRVVCQATVQKGSPNIILANPADIAQFIYPVTEYGITPGYFSAGAKITGFINGNTLVANTTAVNTNPVPQTVLNTIQEMQTAYNTYNTAVTASNYVADNEIADIQAYRRDTSTDEENPGYIYTSVRARIWVGYGSSALIVQIKVPGVTALALNQQQYVDFGIAEKIQTNATELATFIKERIQLWVNTLPTSGSVPVRFGHDVNYGNDTQAGTIANAWAPRIRALMQITYQGVTYYDIPQNLEWRVM
ncbi:MAG: hypothetical protein LBB83_01515 [Treponema sp.]|jgi:hypothetical protein|nr:hypothetical protein [Treponema sp.]